MLYAVLAVGKQYLKWTPLPEQRFLYPLVTKMEVRITKSVVSSYSDVRENEGYLSDPM